jgi:hypothetical protein
VVIGQASNCDLPGKARMPDNMALRASSQVLKDSFADFLSMFMFAIGLKTYLSPRNDVENQNVICHSTAQALVLCLEHGGCFSNIQPVHPTFNGVLV